MPYSLVLSKKLRSEGWKVKIQDKESREEPHITVWRKMQKWRISLRTKKCMDGSDADEIAEDVRKIIEDNWEALQDAWDQRYGEVNPISSEKAER